MPTVPSPTRRIGLVTGVFACLVWLAPAGSAAADSRRVDEASVIASFEGSWIRLAEGWGDARACTSDDAGTRCYRSEAEMDAAEVALNPATVTPMADCSSSVRLYQNTNYGGSVLELKQRGVTISLSPYGFNNVTSSYKIGACSARFYDTTSGGGLYPGSTSANVWASSMATGWNDRVGSVYIL